MPQGQSDRLQSALAGQYRVERKLGEGGMATVYLAEDLKHERPVALKIFRPELAAMLGAERFLAEIKTTANLHHPHILPLFDSGSADGFLFYVMPYVEGESLREKLDRETQLGVDEAVSIARGVGDALDYAHRHGVIHRDIKPANILLHDGRPMVSDFGIALAVSAAGGGRMTETGLSLGTPHYMSPEQASAERELSVRSDVYSLGCVLYEMLAGQPPHTGPTAQSILVRILTEDPRPLSDVRKSVPAHVAATVTKAIEKLPADRFESAASFVSALGDPSFAHAAASRGLQPTASAASPAAATPARRVAGGLAPWALLALSVALGAWGWLGRAPAVVSGPPTVLTLDLQDVPQPTLAAVEISPDGQRFAVPTEGPVYVRDAGTPSFRALPGTEGVTEVSFSPDGEWIVFQRDGELRKMSISGGSPLALARATMRLASPHWGASGSIVFVAQGGIGMVSDEGSDLTSFDVTGLHPHLLPDGRAFLYEDRNGIGLYDIVNGTTRELLAQATTPRYVAATGHILFIHPNGGLFAVSFDADSWDVTGSPVPVIASTGGPTGGRVYSVSEAGTIVHRTLGADSRESRLLLLGPDRTTEELRLAPRAFAHLRFSPDGRFVAFNEGIGRSTLRALFTYDLVLGRSTQVASDGGEHAPVWSPDGTQLAYSLQMEAGPRGEDIYVRPVVGDDPPRRVFTLPDDHHAGSWTRGGLIVAAGAGDVVRVDASATDGAATPYLQGDYDEVDVAVSPNERWAAYESNEDGLDNIYIRSFPEPGEAVRVSTGGGVSPRWSGDGRTVYFRSTNWDTIYAAPVSTDDPPSVGSPSVAWVVPGSAARFWDVDWTSGRAVAAQLIDPLARATDRSVTVVVNWFDQLRQLVGDGR